MSPQKGLKGLLKRWGIVIAGIMSTAIFLALTFLSYGQDEALSASQQKIADTFGPTARFTIMYVPWGDNDEYLVRYET